MIRRDPADPRYKNETNLLVYQDDRISLYVNVKAWRALAPATGSTPLPQRIDPPPRAQAGGAGASNGS